MPHPLPWTIVIPGRPSTLQGSVRRRDDWQSRVAATARAAWLPNLPPLSTEVAFRMAFFHEGGRVDVDNMLKHTMDARMTIR